MIDERKCLEHNDKGLSHNSVVPIKRDAQDQPNDWYQSLHIIDSHLYGTKIMRFNNVVFFISTY